jgi:broad specificity phosphatase PhoE
LDGKEHRILLVRHCEVEECYREVCYGRADVGLSESGRSRSRALAHQLGSASIAQVWHSDLFRTRVLAEALAALVGVQAIACPLLRERDFGAWELRPWQEIYAETGDAMLGMIREPAVWRPPGGETTLEMRDRVLAWFRALPSSGTIVAVTHGGPIAVLRGALAGRPVSEWLGLIPATGSVVEL